MIKAFNTLYARFREPDPRRQAGRQLLFFAGDDADAKASLQSLFETVGLACVDIGALRAGGRLMQIGGGPFPLCTPSSKTDLDPAVSVLPLGRLIISRGLV